MKEFVVLRAKANSYLKDSEEDEKKNGTKTCVIKRIKLKFQDYKNSLEAA